MQDVTDHGAGGDMQLLLSILVDGEEQARRLVGDPPDDDRRTGRAEELECCCRGAAAARQLRCALGKAVAVAKAIEAAGGGASGSRGTDRSDSPRSADESSGGTVRDVAQAQERPGMCKRRKGLPRWTQKFRIPDANLEYTPEDGFSWRKYGQKDILGAKFPRGYYRCTYRNAQGCPATRQVQRSDADLAVFDVTYQGAHTCHQKQRGATSPPPALAAAAAAPTHVDVDRPPPQQQQDSQDLQLLASFKNGLKVETDGPASAPSFQFQGHDGASSAALISFPFSPAESSQQLPGGAFSSSSTSPAPFVSPIGSSYFSASAHCPAALVGTRGAESSSELGEVVSAATASAAVDLRADGFDYSLYQYDAELDPHLPFAPATFGHPPHDQHYYGDW